MKPCPYCLPNCPASIISITKDPATDTYYVYCRYCKMRGPRKNGEKYAKIAWDDLSREREGEERPRRERNQERQCAEAGINYDWVIDDGRIRFVGAGLEKMTFLFDITQTDASFIAGLMSKAFKAGQERRLEEDEREFFMRVVSTQLRAFLRKRQEDS